MRTSGVTEIHFLDKDLRFSAFMKLTYVQGLYTKSDYVIWYEQYL